jgi:hypothetical protein
VKVFNLEFINTLTGNDTTQLSTLKFLEEPNILIEMYMNDPKDINGLMVNKNNMTSLANPIFLR